MTVGNANTPTSADHKSPRSPYAAAAERVQRILTKLGVPDNPNTNASSPILTINIRELSVDALKDLYDSFLVYRGILVHEFARSRGLELAAKANEEHVFAVAMRNAKKFKTEATNAEERKAVALTDASYVAANAELVTLKGLRYALEEEVGQLDKTLDRIGRELFYKTGGMGGGNDRTPTSEPTMRAAYRATSRIVEVAPKTEEPAVQAETPRRPPIRLPTKR